MTYFKRYFLHRLRSTTFRSIVLAVITVIVTFVSVNNSARIYYADERLLCDTGIYFMIYLAMASVIIFPILETAELKKPRSLDLVFAFPITKGQLALVHYFSGAIQMLFINAVSAAVNVFVHLTKGFGLKSFWIIPAYLSIIPIMICFYSVAIFLFSQGNTLGDGIAFVVGVPLALYGIVWCTSGCLSEFDEIFYNCFDAYVISLNICDFTGMLGFPVNFFSQLLDVANTEPAELMGTNIIPILVVWMISGIASVFGFIHYTKNYRTENAGGISDSLFGYKTLIPICAICMVIIMGLKGLTLFSYELDIVLLLVAMAIGYFVYRRSFRIKPSDISVIVYVGILWTIFVRIPTFF